jgi:hypothetical protein
MIPIAFASRIRPTHAAVSAAVILTQVAD